MGATVTMFLDLCATALRWAGVYPLRGSSREIDGCRSYGSYTTVTDAVACVSLFIYGQFSLNVGKQVFGICSDISYVMYMHGFTILLGYGLRPFVCSEQIDFL